MVKLGIEATTLHDLALFKCPTAQCRGFLVPYEVWRSEKATTVFATCFACKKRYRFELEALKRDDWLPALRNFTWRCPFCGETGLDVKKAVGNKVFKVQVSCGKCGKGATKKIEHRTYDVLVAGQQQKPEEVVTTTDENRVVATKKMPATTATFKKAYIICPACDLEIEEAFRGYCPACGFMFSADVEERS
jgi:DNA-directed RNA polymerase subunit M/transcription elongation factor TFIIS